MNYFSKQGLIHSVLGILISISLSACQEKKKEETVVKEEISQPNIIIIVTDDQGYGDIGIHGNEIIKTPHLDKFAKESLELTNFHVGTTCTPTRAGILTGRNANRNNTWHTIAGCSILSEDEETIAEVFEKNGYQTAMFGKWHLGDNQPFRPQDRGFQETVHFKGGGVGQTPDYWNNDYFDDTYYRNETPEKFKGYSTDIWFDEAIGYIKKQKEKPFFMYLATNAAHAPFNVPEEYMNIYKDEELNPGQKRFYGMISNIDDNFGKLNSYLESSGLSDNTIIIYTTDNGTANGINYNKETKKTLGYNAGLRGTKGSHYDGGHRVPFFIKWPKGNLLHNKKVSELIAHVDLLPTLTKLSGISFTPKKVLDGTDVTEILKGKITSLDRMLVVDTQRNQWPEKGRNSCVMSTQWRLVNGDELYNTLTDPGQKKNIADNHPDQVQKMQKFYDTWWQSIQSDIKHAYIPIGKDKAPVYVNIHDLHTEDPLPWNQVQIREGAFHPKGYYTIRVQQSGDYKFELYRYSPESKLKTNENVPAIDATPYKDGLPKGIGIQVSNATVKIGDTLLKAKVDPNSSSVTLNGYLEKGDYKMSSSFANTTGKMFSPYYTIIQKQ